MAGCTLCEDLNGDYFCGNDEANTVTAADGSFALDLGSTTAGVSSGNLLLTPSSTCVDLYTGVVQGYPPCASRCESGQPSDYVAHVASFRAN